MIRATATSPFKINSILPSLLYLRKHLSLNSQLFHAYYVIMRTTFPATAANNNNDTISVAVYVACTFTITVSSPAAATITTTIKKPYNCYWYY